MAIIKQNGQVERSVQVLSDCMAAAAPGFESAAYNQGNEPSLMNVYFFDRMGRPDLAQKWLRAIMDTFYTATPNGYRGQDDDQGQLSGWLVLAAIGIIRHQRRLRRGSSNPYVHTPLFPKITIHLDRNYYQSGVFTIVSKNFTDKSIYIKSAALNGAPLKDLHFDFAKVNANSKLELELSEGMRHDEPVLRHFPAKPICWQFTSGIRRWKEIQAFQFQLFNLGGEGRNRTANARISM